MSTVSSEKRLADDAPAVALPGWLPAASGWDELDALAAEHRQLLSRREEVGSQRFALLRRFEAEDEAHREAMTAAFRENTSAELPEVTPITERNALLAAANEQLRAANDALDGLAAEAIERIEAGAPEWLGDLANRREGAAEQRREAERILAEARAEEVAVARLEEWLRRNAGLHRRAAFRSIPAMRYAAWTEVESSFTPAPEPEDDGMGGLRPQVVNPPHGEPWDAERKRRAMTIKPSAEDLRRSEELRTGGVPVPLVPDARTITHEED